MFLLVAVKSQRVAGFTCIDDATHCIVFAPFPGDFLGPILLVAQVDCCRTSGAEFLSQGVVWPPQDFSCRDICRCVVLLFQAESRTCGRGLSIEIRVTLGWQIM